MILQPVWYRMEKSLQQLRKIDFHALNMTIIFQRKPLNIVLKKVKLLSPTWIM